MWDLGANLVADLEALKGCIQETGRQDHDIWQDSFETLPTQTQKRLQAVIDFNKPISLDLPEQLQSLLKGSWALEELCSRAEVFPRQLDQTRDIVSSLELLADDEAIFSSPGTTLPWVVLLEVMHVCQSHQCFHFALCPRIYQPTDHHSTHTDSWT